FDIDQTNKEKKGSPVPLTIEEHQNLGLDVMVAEEVNGRRNGDDRSTFTHPEDRYEPCPEALMASPEGTLVALENWSESSVYPETRRNIWCYRPLDWDASKPGRVLICNDGRAYVDAAGPVRVPRVLDTLHASGELSNVAAIFVNPGDTDQMPPRSPIASYGLREAQRSWEYDRLSRDYGDFLVREMLPLLSATLDVELSSLPEDRVVCGISSGGIAAFSAAWFQPDQFARVISHCGSYTNILGGHNYPFMVQTTPRKPIRVYIQSGEHDVHSPFGHWPSANQAMARALEYAGYDVNFEFGTGGHTLRHGGARFAETLRWIFRD
ncbi:MAG: alpha/beta hydrolase-fold protein, partial [Pseudomonadales bacterium]